MKDDRNYEDEYEEYAQQECDRMAKEHIENLSKAMDKAAEIHGYGMWINVQMNIHTLTSDKLTAMVKTAIEQYTYL